MAYRDFHHEISVATFWRQVIGQYEYVNYDPEDLYRWYEALETRGPAEIRAYLNERGGKHPMPTLLGLVSKPPHPPMDIVMLWLESHELKVRTSPVWLGVGGFVLLSFMISGLFIGCQNLKSPNLLVMHPGQTSPTLMQPQVSGTPQTGATLPTNSGASTTSSAQGATTSDGAPAIQSH